MRFLVYGAGAIGSIFAGKLALAGQGVTVLARGKRLEELAAQGIRLRDAYTGKTETVSVGVIDRLLPGDRYDYILVVMQITQVGDVLPALSANCSQNIVFVINNPSGYGPWVEAVGAARLMIGFPSAGGERKDDAVHCFIGKGVTRAFQTTTFGEYDGSRSQRLSALVRAFRRSGIPSVACRDMDSWQKTRVAVVTAIGNALYKHNCSNYALSNHGKDVVLMIKAMQEGFRVLRKLGHPVTPAKLNYFRLPAWLVAALFRPVLNTRIAEVAMAKHTIAARAEMIELQNRYDALIARSGLPTPAIDSLRAWLKP